MKRNGKHKSRPYSTPHLSLDLENSIECSIFHHTLVWEERVSVIFCARSKNERLEGNG
jgi:hypothetical protein